MLFQIISWVLKTLGVSQEYIDYIYMFSILKYFNCQAYLQYMDSIDGFPPLATAYMFFPVLVLMLINYIQLYFLKVIIKYFNNKYITILINYNITYRKFNFFFLLSLLLVTTIADILIIFRII
jgi:hypothetical protein